jgi:Polyketide cyclase / dehydrase and lipid transport
VAIHWQFSVIIDRPIEELWAVFLDLFSAPRLPGGSMSLRQTSPGPMGLGTTIQARRVILGFETRLIERITEWDPPHAMTATIEGRPFRSMSERVTLEAVPEGTRVHETLDGELVPALRLIWPLIGPFVRRQRQGQFRALKAKLESETAAPEG